MSSIKSRNRTLSKPMAFFNPGSTSFKIFQIRPMEENYLWLNPEIHNNMKDALNLR